MFTAQPNFLNADTELTGNRSKISGQYETTLKINPREPQVGICNFTINLFDIENKKYITDAKIEIFINNQKGLSMVKI